MIDIRNGEGERSMGTPGPPPFGLEGLVELTPIRHPGESITPGKCGELLIDALQLLIHQRKLDSADDLLGQRTEECQIFRLKNRAVGAFEVEGSKYPALETQWDRVLADDARVEAKIVRIARDIEDELGLAHADGAADDTR